MAKGGEIDGNWLLEVFAALANPHRLRLYGLLAHTPSYVSQLARDIGLSRPLTHIHLQKLEKAGLIEGRLVLSEDGKAMKYFEVTDLEVLLSPRTLERAALDLENKEESQ